MFTLKCKSSRGSIVVDAACSLPVFIMAMSIILLLIAQAGVEDTVCYAMSGASEDVVVALAGSDSLRHSAGSRSAEEHDQLADDVIAYSGFSLGMNGRISSEWGSGASRAGLAWIRTDLEYCLDGGIRLDNLISANVGIKTSVPFSFGFARNHYVGKDILFRRWAGESRQDCVFDDTRVYIFPKSGERYHCSSCSCLKNGEIQMILTDKLRKKYNACPTCQSGALPNGAAVFLMSGGSSAFHRKSCPCVTKAYECVALSDAESMGYGPCGLCGGRAESYNPDSDFFR